MLIKKIATFQIMNVSNFYARQHIRRFHEPYRRGDIKYEKLARAEMADKSKLWHIKNGFKMLKSEINLWKDETVENLKFDPKIYTPGDTDLLWKFNSQDELKKWIVTADKDNHDGYSECDLSLTEYNHGLFNGYLDTRLPLDGRVVRAGYCNITVKPPKKSFQRQTYFNWDYMTHLVIRMRGDGRTYGVNLLCAGYFDVTWFDVYNCFLYTRGGPYWQTAKLPFSKFFLSSKGRIQDKQIAVPKYQISGLGITCVNNPGPFHLEIDYIGVHWDPNHREDFAYEMYHIPRSQLY